MLAEHSACCAKIMIKSTSHLGQSPAQLAQNVYTVRIIDLNLATFDLICVIIVTPGLALDIWGNVQNKPHVCLNMESLATQLCMV